MNTFTLINNPELVERIYSLLVKDRGYTRYDSISLTRFFWKKVENSDFKFLFAFFIQDGIQKMTFQLSSFEEKLNERNNGVIYALDGGNYGTIYNLSISFPDDVNDVTLEGIERQAMQQIM